MAAPTVVGLVVLGSLTLMAAPVLGRFGALPDNPTLLDRPHAAGWAGYGRSDGVGGAGGRLGPGTGRKLRKGGD